MGLYRVWANRLWGNSQPWSKCPPTSRDKVKEVMRQDVAEGRYSNRTAERFEEITGEAYEPAE